MVKDQQEEKEEKFNDEEKAGEFVYLVTPPSSESTPTGHGAQSVLTEPHKDRGYAWVILISSFMCQVLAVGFALSSGVFTTTIIQEYNGSKSEVAWVGSLHSGFLFFAGPLCGILTDRIGYRLTITVGGLIAALGLALSAWATKLWMLYITYGLLGGIGFCLAYIPAVTILASYFDRWKHIAFSVSAAGAGIGTLSLPYYIQHVMEEFGLSGAFILTAGMALQISVFGALIRDPPKPEFTKAITTKQELSVLKDWRFLLFLANNFLFNFGSLIVFIFIADYANSMGLENDKGIYLISILGISNAIGRGLSAVFGICECNRTFVYLFTCLLSGVAIIMVTIPVSCPHPCFLVMAASCTGYGLFFGMQLANLAIVTNALAGVQRLNAAYGIVMLMNGAGAATGPPVAGLLYEAAGYEVSFYVGGAVIIFAGFLMVPVLYQKPQTLDDLPPVRTVGEQLIASIPALNVAISREELALPHSVFDLRFGSRTSLAPPDLFRAKAASFSGLHRNKK